MINAGMWAGKSKTHRGSPYKGLIPLGASVRPRPLSVFTFDLSEFRNHRSRPRHRCESLTVLGVALFLVGNIIVWGTLPSPPTRANQHPPTRSSLRLSLCSGSCSSCFCLISETISDSCQGHSSTE